MPQLPPHHRPLTGVDPSIAPSEGPPPEIMYGEDDGMPTEPNRAPGRPPVETRPVQRKYTGRRIGINKLSMKTYSPNTDEVIKGLTAQEG